MPIARALAACVGGWLMLSIFGPGLAVAQADPAPWSAHGDTRLAALIAEALDRNPGLMEARLGRAAARHQIAQAGALPDPTLSFSWHPQQPQTRTGPQQAGISLSQKLPWFGKRADREAVARKLAEVHDESVALRAADLIRQVKFAYHDLAWLDSALGIVTRELGVLRLHESLAQARYAQGAGQQQAVARLQAEITQALSRHNRLQQGRIETEASLNALRDRPGNEPIAEVRLGPLPTVEIEEKRLLQLGQSRRPELRAARLRIATEEDRLRIAERDHLPDLTLAAAWGRVGERRDLAGRRSPPQGNGDDTATLSLGVTLPLRQSRYRAGKGEALARLDAARAAYRDAQRQLDADLRMVGVRVRMVHERIILVKQTLLPQLEQAWRTAEAAWSTAAIGAQELLQSERMLLNAQLDLARLETDYMQALADLERMLGAALPDEPK